MLVINEPLGLFTLGCLVVIFCIIKFRKQSAMNKEIWRHIRENIGDKVEQNSIDIAKHENRLQMQSDHFDILDKDMERAKNTSQNALTLCFNMVNYIKNKP